MQRPCLYCKQLTHNTPATCDTCQTKHPTAKARRNYPPKQSATRRGYGPAWRRLRIAILERDQHTCYLCGHHATTVDHIVAKRNGGTDAPWNLAACCRACQNRKGDQRRQ